MTSSDSDKALIAALEKRIEALEKSQKPKKERAPREPSAFNIFMKKTIAEIKKETPDIAHSEAWSQATAKWKESKEQK